MKRYKDKDYLLDYRSSYYVADQILRDILVELERLKGREEPNEKRFDQLNVHINDVLALKLSINKLIGNMTPSILVMRPKGSNRNNQKPGTKSNNVGAANRSQLMFARRRQGSILNLQRLGLLKISFLPT